MGRITVDLLHGQPKALLSRSNRQKVLHATAVKRGPDFAKYHREDVRKTATHYTDALANTLKTVLGRGGAPTGISAPAEGASAPRAIRFIDGQGKSRRLVTRPWRALTRKYRNRTPISVQFWHKTEALSKAFNSKVFPRIGVAVTVGKGTGVVKAGGDKVTYTSVATMKLRKLPYPWSKILNKSFMAGEERVFRPAVAAYDREIDLQRAAYPEYRRPFIAALAARMGKLLFVRLRKLR